MQWVPLLLCGIFMYLYKVEQLLQERLRTSHARIVYRLVVRILTWEGGVQS